MSVAERLTDWLPILWFFFVVVLGCLLWTSGLIPGLLKRMKKFGGFGLEFEFSEDSAKQTRDSIESALEGVRQTIRRELEADVRARGLQGGLRTLLERCLGNIDEYRATIHVQDPLYENWLYQLLDYHPRGSGHGRTFSTRAGIIGLAWRLDEYQEWQQSSRITQEQLIQQWGMTDREASERKATDGTKVMMAVPLRDALGNGPVGILYMDSKIEDYFGSTEEDRRRLARELQTGYEVQMATSLSDLVESALRRSPQLALEAK